MQRICPHCGYEGAEARCPNDDYPTVDPTHFVLKEGIPDLAGKILADRYELAESIGSGATGWVFKARHLSTRQKVAVKIMRRDLTRKLVAIRRFYQEARACSNLVHPNVIRVYDFGASDDGFLYMVMEYLDGESLHERVKRDGPLEPQTVVKFGLQIASGLEAAHDAGIIHRDLKPANIHLCRMHKKKDVVKILDFGLAKAIDNDELAVGITAAGFLVGSPGYIAPEQIMGQRADGRADLYALGVTLYRILTGHLPVAASTVEELVKKQMTEKPMPIQGRIGTHDIPPDLSALIMRLLRLDAAERLQSAGEVIEALGDIAAGRRPKFVAVEIPSHIAVMEDVQTLDEEKSELPEHSVISRHRRSRRWQWTALAVTLLAGVGLAVAGGIAGGDGQTLPAVKAVSKRADPIPAADKTAEKTADEVRAANRVPTGPELNVEDDEPVLVERLILVNSKPPGAQVREGALIVGKTPLNVPLVEGKRRKLRLAYPGADAKFIVLDDKSEDSVTIVFEDILTAAPVTTTRHAAGTPSDGPKKKKKKRRAVKKKLKIRVL